MSQVMVHGWTTGTFTNTTVHQFDERLCVTSDIPSEVRLQPLNWGSFTILDESALSR